MSMKDRMTIELTNDEAQFLLQVLSRYESDQLDRSEKLLPAERFDASIYENVQAALELMQKIQQAQTAHLANS